jgi:hypothetical protein
VKGEAEGIEEIGDRECLSVAMGLVKDDEERRTLSSYLNRREWEKVGYR